MPANPKTYRAFTPEERTRHHQAKRTNKTGFLGVKWNRHKGTFQAWIRDHRTGKKVYAGSGCTAEACARKYDAKAVELFGVGAVTNFTRETP